MGTKSVEGRKQIYISDQLHEELHGWKAETGRSIRYMVEKALKRYFDTEALLDRQKASRDRRIN